MNRVVFLLFLTGFLSSSVVDASSLNDNLIAASSGVGLFTGSSSSFNLDQDYNFIHIVFGLLGEEQDLVITNVSFRLFKLLYRFADFDPKGKGFLEIYRILTLNFQKLEQTFDHKFTTNDSIGYSILANPMEEIERELATEKGLIVGFKIRFLRTLEDLNPEPANINYNFIWLNFSFVLLAVIRTSKARNKP